MHQSNKVFNYSLTNTDISMTTGTNKSSYQFNLFTRIGLDTVFFFSFWWKVSEELRTKVLKTSTVKCQWSLYAVFLQSISTDERRIRNVFFPTVTPRNRHWYGKSGCPTVFYRKVVLISLSEKKTCRSCLQSVFFSTFCFSKHIQQILSENLRDTRGQVIL